MNGLNAQWTFSPGIISRVSREHNGAWRDWYVAEWPGREVREFTSYEAAERYLQQQKAQPYTRHNKEQGFGHLS